MVENPYPIPRQLRQSGILVGDGGDTYGPFDFSIFDPEDVSVFIREENEPRFQELNGVVITKVNGNSATNALDKFTFKAPENLPATTRYLVLSSRLAARAAGVISGTKLDPTALEKELSKIATQQQELRRDLDRSWKSDFGQPGMTMDANLADGDTFMKDGGRIVKGPNAQEIAEAQGYAVDARESKEASAASAALAQEAEEHAVEVTVALQYEVTAAINDMEDKLEAAAEGYRVAITWAELVTVTDVIDRQLGRVTGPDGGTHVDPVTGQNVPNIGDYRRIGSAWQRTGDVADANAIKAATNRISQIDFTLETSLRIAPFRLDRRQLVAETLSFDLRPMRGFWLDTKLPWQADGAFARAVNFPNIIQVDNKAILVSLWSFDLRPLAGIELETGNAWPPVAPPDGGGAFPEMVVTTSSALVTTYFKAGNSDEATYIAWPIERVTNVSRNTDVWRSGRPYEATRRETGDFLFVRYFWVDSEVETAIQIAGAYDHAGGKAHGNEEMTEAAIWLIDGVEITPSDGTTYLPGKVELVFKTRMFQPGTSSGTQFSPKGDPFVALVKYITIEEGHYSIRHHVEELKASLGIQYGFFGMCPIARVDGATQITHTAIREPLFAKEDVSAESHAIVEDKSERVKIWGDRYSADLRILDGWTDASRLVYVDNRPNYNKIYPGFFRGGTHITTVGAKYTTEVSIKLSVKEQ